MRALSKFNATRRVSRPRLIRGNSGQFSTISGMWPLCLRSRSRKSADFSLTDTGVTEWLDRAAGW